MPAVPRLSPVGFSLSQQNQEYWSDPTPYDGEGADEGWSGEEEEEEEEEIVLFAAEMPELEDFQVSFLPLYHASPHALSVLLSPPPPTLT